MNAINRRQFNGNLVKSLAAISALPVFSGCSSSKRTVLLKSGWQTVNIGDIAHTPGLLALMEKYLPNVQVILWPNAVDRGVAPMLQKRFPNLAIVEGNFDRAGVTESQELELAFQQADFLLHGSGPSVVGLAALQTWYTRTGKPFGILGVTVAEIWQALYDLLQHASFLFTRETLSLENVKQANLDIPFTGFAPDATFAIDLLDEENATALLAQHQLADKDFICVVPRLRKTPYYKIHPNNNWTAEQIKEVDILNAQYKEKDAAKLRHVIIEWARQTGKKVLLCPEMIYQVELLDPLLFAPLPDDVKPNVVNLNRYWLPDEAGSVYKRACAVVSAECHSPIIACAHGTPGFYIRQPEDTIKGQMWYDIGLQDWVFEIEATTGADIFARLQQVENNYAAALQNLENAMHTVHSLHKKAMQIVKQVLYAD